LNFSDLELDPQLCQVATQMGFTQPSAIQQLTIPNVLKRRDLLALAPTGSGKTAAYALPIVQLGKRSIVLVPTRELATQVGKVFSQLCRLLNDRAKIVVAIGGLSINPQMMQLRGGADVLIATPGRLLDLAQHNAVHLNEFEIVVLDEADRLLSLGFADELNAIAQQLLRQRQTLLFSATFEDKVKTLAESFLRNPLQLEVLAQGTEKPNITQRAIGVEDKRRTQLLAHLIKQGQAVQASSASTTQVVNAQEPNALADSHPWHRVLVFVASKYGASHVAEKLTRQKIKAQAFHGDLSQGARTQALDDFKAQRCDVLVTTDLAARGLDIKHLPVVINYDLPRSANDYVHRIGRTGRAGAQGLAINFVTPEQASHFKLIEKRNKFELERENIAGFEMTTLTPTQVATD
jgi:ATP-dependent RNA helicase RhlE